MNNNIISFQKFLQSKNIAVFPPKIKGGIPKEYIINKDDDFDKFICSICNQFVIEPTILTCECNSIYCKYCSTNSFKYKNCCPTCRKNNITIVRSKKIDDVMGNYKLKCLNKKCLKIVKYLDYQTHIVTCPENKYKCLNEGCNFTSNLIEIENHSNNCNYKPIECKYCHLILIKKDYKNHLDKLCKAPFQCPKCLENFERGFYNTNHFSENNENIECLKKQVEKLNSYILSYQENTEKKIQNLNKKLEKNNLEKKELINSIINLKGAIKDYMEMSFNNIINTMEKGKEKEKEKENTKKIRGRNYQGNEQIGRYNTARNSPSKYNQFV